MSLHHNLYNNITYTKHIANEGQECLPTIPVHYYFIALLFYFRIEKKTDITSIFF